MIMQAAAADIIRISMADTAELQRLAWFSPAFPVGGFAYSQGLEKAVETGDVIDAETLFRWLDAGLRFGAARNDAILLAESWRAGASEARLREIAELGIALALSRERRLETVQQGASFHALILGAFPHTDLPVLEGVDLPYPVAVGLAGAVHGQPLVPLVAACLQASVSNLIAAGIRLSIIGQSKAQQVLAQLLPAIGGLASRAERLTLDDLGTMAFRVDLMNLRHEAQQVRLFRS